MKIPGMFIPEYKSLEQKTEQLLEEAKTIKEDILSEKEKQLEELLAQFDRPVESRDSYIHYVILKALNDEGYTPRTPSHFQFEYWVKNVSPSETGVFFKKYDRADHTPKDYCFALLRPENLERFYKRYERYEKEKRLGRRGVFGSYSRLNYFLGGLAGGMAAQFLIKYFMDYVGGPEMIREMLHGMITAIGFFTGGFIFDEYCHKRDEKKMLKLCSYFTENDKEAVRRALM